jgi:hypothetical protein
MEENGDFTNTVNFRRLAGLLRDVQNPDTETILRVAKQDAVLGPWVERQLEANLEGFRESLEFYMTEA